MLFSLGQVLGLLCARMGAVQSCGIYSKSILPSLGSARWARGISITCKAPYGRCRVILEEWNLFSLGSARWARGISITCKATCGRCREI